MKKPNITPSSAFTDMLIQIKKEMDNAIIAWMAFLGGAICMEYYHTDCDCDRYTFYETDDNGYGHELYIDRIFTQHGKIWFTMSDSEDSYEVEKTLEEFTTSETKSILADIEGAANYILETGEKVITEYPE